MMKRRETEDAIRRTLTVPVSPARAFTLFTAEMDTWWPLEYTWAKDTLDTIGLEPREGGRCFERGPHGFECDWGRVLEWVPPRRLRFAWQISPARAPEPDPRKASAVELHFEADGEERTHLTLEHRHFLNHGEGGPDYRAAMDSPRGWTYILERYKAAATTTSAA